MDQTIMITPVMATALLILSSFGVAALFLVVALILAYPVKGRITAKTVARMQADQTRKGFEQRWAEWDRRDDHGKFTKINGVYRVHQPVDIRA